jgi:transcriptional regulator with XRE-family HTH domain
MNSTLNTELLSSMIKSKRGKKGLRETALEITKETGSKISSATLSRIEQFKLPDVETLILICKWLQVSTETFIISPPTDAQEVSEKDMIVYQLRASRQLDQESIDTMIKMIDFAYNNVRRDGKK